MKNLLRMELAKAFRNKWFLIALLAGTAVALLAALDGVRNYYAGGFDVLDTTEYQFVSAKSCYVGWIGVGSLANSFARELFFYLAPLLAVVPYAWSMRTELINGYAAQVFSRTSRVRYLAAKSAAVFASAAVVTLIPLLANLLTLACFVPARIPQIFDSTYIGMFPESLWSGLFYTHPLLFVLAYSLLDALMCGIWALFVLGLSYVVENRVTLFVSSYLGMLVFEFANNTIFIALGGICGFQLSLFNLLQCLNIPYMHDGRIMAVEFLLLAAVAFVLSWRGSRRDVL